MSVTESIMRYHLIISKLKNCPAPLMEINDFLKRESEFHGYNLVRDKRTFKRDLDSIRSIYDIDIQYDFKNGVYEIVPAEENSKNLRMVEALDLFNALKLSENITDIVHFEKRKPSGSEHLNGFLHAIKNRFQVQFLYQKYWEDSPQIRKAEPYALKEFKNRWYLLAIDTSNGETRTFALDRMTGLNVTNLKFQYKTTIDAGKFFKNCFGIIAPTDQEPQEIVLSFDAYQGKYIKSLPLHASQEVLIDNDEEVRVKLTVYLTFDFVMEILSHGDKVKVIKPANLIKHILKVYRKAIAQYDGQ